WIADVEDAQMSRSGTRPFQARGVEVSFLMEGDRFTLSADGRLATVTSRRPEVTPRSYAEREDRLAGDVFGAGQLTLALRTMITRGLTRIVAEAQPSSGQGTKLSSALP